MNTSSLPDGEFTKSIILHIPHASTKLNGGYYTNPYEAHKELMLTTDWYADKIFDLPFPTHQPEFSRVVCDVERLPDHEEPMAKVGMGWYYTHSDSGKEIRKDNMAYRYEVNHTLYFPYHAHFTNRVWQMLNYQKVCTIIDCHTFNNNPTKRDLNQDPDRPDICIGTDDYHTPDWLTKYVVNFLEKKGFTVKVNNPYSGTMVPLTYYQKDKRVQSIMIEVNKRLYLEEDQDTFERIKYLNNIFREMLFNY